MSHDSLPDRPLWVRMLERCGQSGHAVAAPADGGSVKACHGEQHPSADALTCRSSCMEGANRCPQS